MLTGEKFSGGNFSAGSQEIPKTFFGRNIFHQKKFPDFSASGRNFRDGIFTRVPVSSSTFPGIIISTGKNSGGKLETLPMPRQNPKNVV